MSAGKAGSCLTVGQSCTAEDNEAGGFRVCGTGCRLQTGAKCVATSNELAGFYAWGEDAVLSVGDECSAMCNRGYGCCARKGGVITVGPNFDAADNKKGASVAQDKASKVPELP